MLSAVIAAMCPNLKEPQKESLKAGNSAAVYSLMANWYVLVGGCHLLTMMFKNYREVEENRV